MELNSRQIKRIKIYPNVKYDLMIKMHDWVLKYSNVVTSPVTNYILLVQDEEIGKCFVCIYI